MEQLALFDYEQLTLAQLETIVERGLSTFTETGLALLAIREAKKYREAGYSDFGKYLEERWGISRGYGYRLMNAGFIANELSTIVDKIPTHETQLKPLSRLGTSENPAPEKWAEAWSQACELADGRQPTEKEVDFVVKEMLWSNPPPIPTGEYRVIYADPPWQFDNSGFDQSADAHYPTMPTDKIAQLIIPGASDSVCFMWATNAMLEDALTVMQAWGFDYKTNMVWAKETGPTIGFYVTSRHELLLIGTKGQHMLPEVRPVSVIKGEVTEHSRKPAAVCDMIESMYDGPYLELFARVRREGWDLWGNENV